MKRDEVIRVLREHRGELREQLGVKSLALFGSMARNEATPSSDIDILVELDKPVSLFDLIGLQLHLQRLRGVPEVDVVMRDSIYPAIKDDILNEAIDVCLRTVWIVDRGLDAPRLVTAYPREE